MVVRRLISLCQALTTLPSTTHEPPRRVAWFRFLGLVVPRAQYPLLKEYALIQVSFLVLVYLEVHG